MSNSTMILLAVAVVFAVAVFWATVFERMQECEKTGGDAFVDRLYRVVCVSKQQVWSES